jgi:hypothetical protein
MRSQFYITHQLQIVSTNNFAGAVFLVRGLKRAGERLVVRTGVVSCLTRRIQGRDTYESKDLAFATQNMLHPPFAPSSISVSRQRESLEGNFSRAAPCVNFSPSW